MDSKAIATVIMRRARLEGRLTGIIDELNDIGNGKRESDQIIRGITLTARSATMLFAIEQFDILEAELRKGTPNA